jgi:predicted transcriptional regulator
MKYKKLTRAEEEIMKLIWDQEEPCTVSQLIEDMNVKPKPPHSTISTIIRTLEKKEFVDHKSYGRTHAYFAKIEKKEYTRFSLRKLMVNYFDGSPNELVSFLVRENNLSLQDLSEIIDSIEDGEIDQSESKSL